MKTYFIFAKHLLFISFIYFSNMLNASDGFIRDLFEEVPVGDHYISLAQKFSVKIPLENQALLIKIAKTAFPENDCIYKRAEAIQYIVENCTIRSLNTINIINKLLLASQPTFLGCGRLERMEKFKLTVKKISC